MKGYKLGQLGFRHCAVLVNELINFEAGFHYVTQAGLEM
jgi:hypothetical protein